MIYYQFYTNLTKLTMSDAILLWVLRLGVMFEATAEGT